MDISCDCYEKMIGLLMATTAFDNALQEARREKQTTEFILELGNKYALPLKQSINDAVKCGLSEVSLAPIARGQKLTSLVDEATNYLGHTRALDRLWDGIMDNLYRVKPCHIPDKD